MKTPAQARSNRRSHAPAAAFGAETLEPRQMLAADLAVSFQEFTLPATLVPGDRFVAGIFIDNNGPMAANGLVSINFFLSADVNFDAGDTNIGSFPAQPIFLDSEGENSFGDFADQVYIPPTAVAGNYFLLVRITPNAQVNDTNQSNNVAATENFHPLEIRFGAIPGRTSTAILEQLDPEGTVVQFQLFDGGSGTIVRGKDGSFDVNVTGSGANSRLGIATSGGDGIVDIDDITVAGSIASITAASARLRGDVAVSGTLGSLTLGDVGRTTGLATISIGLSGVQTAITLGTVSNATITTPGALESLEVESWTDTPASSTDLISAQWITTLTSEGNFGASLLLSGHSGGATLGTADIGGSLTGGSWLINGRGGSVEAFTTTVQWSASFALLLTSFTTERTFRGTLAAKTIQSVVIGLDLAGARILAGAYLGSDARLGGTGEAADTFSFGNINMLTVAGKVKNTIVGAGLDPVNGVLNDGDDRIRNPFKSKMGDVTIGSTMAPAARIVSGRFIGDVFVNGVQRDPATDARFRIRDLAPPSAELLSADVSVVPSIIRVNFGDNVAISRASIGNGDIRIDAPGNAFSLFVELVSISRATDGTPMVATYRLTPPGGTWDALENGTYSVVLLAGAVTDSSGNAVGSGGPVALGTFEVLV